MVGIAGIIRLGQKTKRINSFGQILLVLGVGIYPISKQQVTLLCNTWLVSTVGNS